MIPFLIAFLGIPVYQDSTKPIDDRVADLLSRMTLEEKISMLHGDSKFTTAAIPRLGIPRRWLSDGPHGVREDIGPDTWNPAGRTDDFATYMPANICLAASWNPELAYQYGATIGQEAKARGKHIMLAPGVNIMRTPLNGRNFEYMGEDPWLASRMAVGYIKGEQDQDVASCVKHFAFNNQEYQRNSINVEMDDRTMREIYLPAFKAAVQEAGVLCVMGAYNRFRSTYCCENDLLLNQILKRQWGFKGLVVSDWGGAHTTDGSALGGLDLEMGSNGPYNKYFLADPFMEGLKSGKYPMALLDDKVRRNLYVMIASHALDSKKTGSFNTVAHQASARQVAEEGLVLLKNDNSILPLSSTKVKSIAIIGENATKKFAPGGQSAGIKAFYEVTPLQGIINAVGNDVTITYSSGYVQPPFRRSSSDHVHTEDPSLENRIDRAVAAARDADVAIVFAGLNHAVGFDSESGDRQDMKLPFNQDELIQKVVAANPKTIVVMTSGAPVEMDAWVGKVPGLLQCWYAGMEGGTAIAKTLFGDVNPSGKLPCTFPHKLEDTPTSHFNSYPGKDGQEFYAEGLNVGYRWYDTQKIEPLFPFGFGLSYTTFAYENLVTKITTNDLMSVQFEVKNTGSRDGAEVAQVYVVPGKQALPRPLKELKAFQKVKLSASKTERLSLLIDLKSLGYYHPEKQFWVTEAGTYTIEVGSSSRDIRLRGTIEVPKTIVTPEN